MSKIWDTLIDIQHVLQAHFESTGKEIQEPGMDRFNQPGWMNRVWTSDNYRRAHIDVVDTRDIKGLWMMHCCIFPHVHNDAPIFGFDVIAGKNIITGCFHDYSVTVNKDHDMCIWFAEHVKHLSWRKVRELPTWANRIFSPSMVAASQVTCETELQQISQMVKDTVSYYLQHVGASNHRDVNSTEAQNYYATNQKENPHTPRVMAKLGLKEDDIKVFIQNCLFPEI
jgi:hypothetical protein